MTPLLDVPEAGRRKALDAGELGRAWLEALPARVGALAREWGLTLSRVQPSGSKAFVSLVATPEGEEAVLKVPLPALDAATRELQSRLRRDRATPDSSAPT